MGYTHYWTQTRSFTADEWVDVVKDIRKILAFAQLAVPLGNGEGKLGSKPVFKTNHIMFNGVGEDAHETFVLNRVRQKNWSGSFGDFCKTARNPYDGVVTACLCYLSSVAETHHVNSDGNGSDFIVGLALAKVALPEKENILDIPMGVMEEDRWTGPWLHQNRFESGYAVRFCVNGKGYVQHLKSKEWYCFPTHLELGKFLDANKQAVFARGGGSGRFGSYDRVEPNIWEATGAFDPARHDRLAKAQAKVLKTLFPVSPEHSEQPPAYVRPGDIPEFTFRYWLKDLLESELRVE